MSVKVSVIIPTYNRAECLLRSVKSVFNQSFTDFELIVVDDGSTDNTQSVMDEYFEDLVNSELSENKFTNNNNDDFSSLLNDLEGGEDKITSLKKYKYKIFVYCSASDFKDKIKYIKLEKNYGVSTARNIGISIAKGQLISFLDSDDKWLENKLEKQVSLYEEEKFKLCHSDEIWIRNGKRVNPKAKHKKSGGNIFEKSLELCLVSPSAVMIEKSVFDELGLFNEKFPVCEDYDLWLRIASRYEVHFIDEKLIVKYGGHSDQLSNMYWGNDIYRIKSLIKLLKNSKLTNEQIDLVKKQIVKKSEVLKKGFLKRFKLINFLKYKFISSKYSN